MKKIILKLILCLSLIAAVIVLVKLRGIRIDERNFPDETLRRSVHRCDLDKNGYLSKKELEKADHLVVSSGCADISGIEYLTNLESISFSNDCPDLSGAEQLTNLKKIELYHCEFSETFVFDNDIPITEFKCYSCIFKNGIRFRNDFVESVELGYCGWGECLASGDLFFADCDKLSGFRAEFDPAEFNLEESDSMQELSFNIDLSGCDSLDWLTITSDKEQTITSVDLSNCSKLSTFNIYEWGYVGDDEKELTLNISGSPNIEGAKISSKRIKELDISDCPHLISASEQTPSEERFAGLRYESDDGWIEVKNEQLMFIK